MMPQKLPFRPAFVVAMPSKSTQHSLRSNLCICTRLHEGSWFGVRLHNVSRPPVAVHSSERSVVRCVFGGGGILGVGPQELLVIAAVGWFLLGPKQLLALSKDIGKIVGEIRSAANEAKTTFTDALESDMAALEEEEEEMSAKSSAATSKVVGPLPLTMDEDERTVADGEVFVSPMSDVSTANDAGERKKFLEQLQRAADPEQVAPTEIPDLDLDAELEVARLEQQLLAAREKLTRKRKSMSESGAASGGQSLSDEMKNDQF